MSSKGLGPAIIDIGAMRSVPAINNPDANFENTGQPLPVVRELGPDVGSRQMNTLTQLRYQQMEKSVFVHTPFGLPTTNLSPGQNVNIRLPYDEVVPV